MTIEFEGFQIKPGVCTLLELNKVVIKRLPKPYSNCQTESNSFLFNRMKKLKYVYRQKVCLELCVQKYILDNCGCHNSPWPEVFTEKYCIEPDESDCSIKFFYESFTSNFYNSNCLDLCPGK